MSAFTGVQHHRYIHLCSNESREGRNSFNLGSRCRIEHKPVAVQHVLIWSFTAFHSNLLSGIGTCTKLKKGERKKVRKLYLKQKTIVKLRTYTFFSFTSLVKYFYLNVEKTYRKHNTISNNLSIMTNPEKDFCQFEVPSVLCTIMRKSRNDAYRHIKVFKK